MTTQTTKRDVYEIITERIINCLERGIIPWKQSWAEAGLPQNLISKKSYRGINLWLLASLGFERNLFITKKQLSDLGGTLKEDNAIGYDVVYWNWLEETGEIPEEKSRKKRPFLRYYRVYNVSQCDGIPEDLIPAMWFPGNESIETCDSIIDNMPMRPLIQYNDLRAYYHPVYDYVNMPRLETFTDSVSYYATLFHELVHSTGHQKRLGRKGVVEETQFGRKEYSFEELIAEMGASYLKSHAGILNDSNLEDNASYIGGWLKVLKNDKRFVIYASAFAQKAVDFILGIETSTNETNGE